MIKPKWRGWIHTVTAPLAFAAGLVLVLLAPTPRGYRGLARSTGSGPETWAHPALADGRLYVRDRKELICLNLAK